MLSNFSCVPLFATLWTLAHQAPLSIVFSRQEYWGGLPFPSPGDLPDPGIKPMSLKSPALASGFFTTRATQEAHLVTPNNEVPLTVPLPQHTHTHTHTHTKPYHHTRHGSVSPTRSQIKATNLHHPSRPSASVPANQVIWILRVH